MKLSFGGDWHATVTDGPLNLTPRFTGSSVEVAPYTDRAERERFFANTFGSEHWLWDMPDVFRFEPEGRKLAGAELQMPYVVAASETRTRLPAMPEVQAGGLRADEVRDFRMDFCMVLCRAPGDASLACLRDLDVLAKPLDARIGIAPDMALLVQNGTVVGWSLADPARYLASAFTAPDPDPPSSATRRLLTECLDLVTAPLLDEVEDGDPAAVGRLRAADEALRTQREDRQRADVLRAMIATYLEDYGS